MKEPTNKDILAMLEKDSIGRNNQLNQLIKFINSFKDNTVISIDGAWGTGKTVFVKQLYLIATSDEDMQARGVNKTNIEKLRETYNAYYFNAWENDYLGDPLQAILYKLISERLDGLQGESLKKALAMIKPAKLIKDISKGSIDINSKTADKKLVNYITTIVNRKKTISELLDKLIKDNKRLLFIIDELDRCKPSFAVELLEVLKHYFNRENTTFIIATHTTELAHTIQKYYGYGVDGMMYLGKFYDYNMQLGTIEARRYKEYTEAECHPSATDIANFLDMSMRDMNSYFSALRLVNNYINTGGWADDSDLEQTVRFVFIPLALGLQIKHDKKCANFIQGGGTMSNDRNESYDLLRNLFSSSRNVQNFTQHIDGKGKFMDSDGNKLVNQYEKLFSNNQDTDAKEIRKGFQDVVSLISTYSTIDTEEENY